MLLFPWPEQVIYSQLGPRLAWLSSGLLVSLGMCIVLSSGFQNTLLTATKQPNLSRSLCFDKSVLKVSVWGAVFVLDTVCSFY